MRTDLIQKIATYGDKYVEENLNDYNKSELLIDWQMGLDFLFDHSFYQGRKDEIARKVENKAKDTLKNYIKENDNNPEVILNQENFSEIRSRLSNDIGKGKIGKGNDVEMVISILKFISERNEQNIIKYSISRIQDGKIVDHFKELDTIYSIGPKCSSFYLRDLICMYNEDVKIQQENEFECLQPIDVWVRKVALITEIIDNLKEKDKIIRRNIVKACSDAGVPSIKFNQGAWYIGRNSFDIVIDNLKRT